MSDCHKVELVNEGATIDVPDHMTILEAAAENGIDLPSQCRMGLCGVCCGMRTEDGEVDQTEGMFLSEQEIEEGYVLTCIAKPQSDLSLESNRSP